MAAQACFVARNDFPISAAATAKPASTDADRPRWSTSSLVAGRSRLLQKLGSGSAEGVDRMRDYDVVVLGAGAAGLVAAARAAECGVRVLLAEKNRRPGVKILMSGGTRCNITNARGLRRLDVVSGPVDPAYDTG